ncbi:MAG: hypothetical protein A2219_00485 [Elusimicrobia bacterium RIFOXYA2_FULL_50_26]|nr:MAG: hypothetical protein A2219_00485 [Elusimicrobia bacterium RIFOXYA2_FULL_50_26]OGS24677.1 MAG: hypothetical protein A2314_03805 [Elusimicrobia bacterium RIFOXYB2_FULL_50_12]
MARYAGTIILIVCAASFAFADDAGKSQTAAAYLWLAPSPRTMAMGNTFTALADDAAALYYNPAGASLINGHELLLTSSLMGDGRAYNFAGYVYGRRRDIRDKGWSWGSGMIKTTQAKRKIFLPREDKQSAWGFSFTGFGVGGIELRDEFGNEGGSFSDTENTIAVTYAANMYSDLRWGITIKRYGQSLYTAQASGLGGDLGFLYRNPGRKWSLGLALQNIGGSLGWKIPNDITNDNDEYAEAIRLTSRLGGAYPLSEKLTVLTDFGYTQGQNIAWHGGAEYRFRPEAVLRAGLDGLNPAAGFGYRFARQRYGLSADYAFSLLREQMYVLHNFSITLSYGAPAPRQNKIKSAPVKKKETSVKTKPPKQIQKPAPPPATKKKSPEKPKIIKKKKEPPKVPEKSDDDW